MLVTMVMLSLIKGQGELPENAGNTESIFIDFWWFPLVVALVLGITAITLDALTPRKKLQGMSSIIFGLITGLLVTVAMSWIIDLLLESRGTVFEPGTANARVLIAIKSAFAITLCYLGVTVVYTTQDEFRLVIPYIEFSKQMRGVRPLILDTSVIIDGRFNDICATGFITAPSVVPRFVIHELQALADSSDKLKRNRGRRGLDMIRKMQNNPHLDLNISDEEVPGAGVDQMLLSLAQQHQAHLLTTDFNLNKVASIHGVKVLNINDLANSLKPVAIPGQVMQIVVAKRGEGNTQGVGYLEDGTMVVIENAMNAIGKNITCTVTSSIQTSAGRMIFANLDELSSHMDQSSLQEEANSMPQLDADYEHSATDFSKPDTPTDTREVDQSAKTGQSDTQSQSSTPPKSSPIKQHGTRRSPPGRNPRRSK